ncbi:hypothetical protein BDR07DRAFT_1398334 [Suillus spraguei]|nr:hypothetical protein BDR07DRAFT_1398334 [Suillus spraguei]
MKEGCGNHNMVMSAPMVTWAQGALIVNWHNRCRINIKPNCTLSIATIGSSASRARSIDLATARNSQG